MKRLTPLLFIAPLILLNLYGCKSTGYLLVPNENQTVVYSKGYPYVSGGSGGIQLTVAPIQDVRDNRIAMVVAVNNTSQAPITVSPENFSVSTTKGSGVVLTYQQLKAEIDSKVFWQSLSAGLNRASESYRNQNSGYSYSSGSVYGNNQYYSYSGYNYDQSKVNQAQQYSDQKFQGEIDNIQDFKSSALSGIDGVLKKETVLPGKSAIFTLVLELMDPIPDEIVNFVMINNSDEISFKFIVAKPN